MSVLMQINKKQFYDCEFAAVSPLTGLFVAYILDETEENIREWFEEPGILIVYNEKTGVRLYDSFQHVSEIRTEQNGVVLILGEEEREDDNGGNRNVV